MNWLWLVGVGIVGLLGGYFIGARVIASATQPGLNELRFERLQLLRNQASDRDFLLRVLRRELANWMIRRDPDRYLDVYRTAHKAVTAILGADKNQQRMQLTQLSEKYPFYLDFDFVGTYEHVLYPDGLSGHSFDDIEQFYEDIILFQALQVSIDDNWRGKEPTSERNLELVEKYILRIKDTRLKAKLKAAVREFWLYKNWINKFNVNEPVGNLLYDSSQFSVQYVPHFAETRYGIHFKDTDEFGLYSSFYDGPDRDFQNYYRSSPGFSDENGFNDLRLDESI